MGLDSEPEASARRREIAGALREYLREASEQPVAPPEPESDSSGWFAAAPGSGAEQYGREPWTSIRDAVTGSDSLVTRPDVLLDSSNWQSRALPVGGDVFVVVPASEDSRVNRLPKN